MSTEHTRITLRAGPCAACGHAYALDLEYRCAGCDRGVCAICVVTVRERRTAWCPECAPEPEAEG